MVESRATRAIGRKERAASEEREGGKGEPYLKGGKSELRLKGTMGEVYLRDEDAKSHWCALECPDIDKARCEWSEWDPRIVVLECRDSASSATEMQANLHRL